MSVAPPPSTLEILLPDFTVHHIPFTQPSLSFYQPVLNDLIRTRFGVRFPYTLSVSSFQPDTCHTLTDSDDLTHFSQFRFILSDQRDLMASTKLCRAISIRCASPPSFDITLDVFQDTLLSALEPALLSRLNCRQLTFLYRGRFLRRDITVWNLGISDDEVLVAFPQLRLRLACHPGYSHDFWFFVRTPPVETLPDLFDAVRQSNPFSPNALSHRGKAVTSLEELFECFLVENRFEIGLENRAAYSFVGELGDGRELRFTGEFENDTPLGNCRRKLLESWGKELRRSLEIEFVSTPDSAPIGQRNRPIKVKVFPSPITVNFPERAVECARRNPAQTFAELAKCFGERKYEFVDRNRCKIPGETRVVDWDESRAIFAWAVYRFEFDCLDGAVEMAVDGARTLGDVVAECLGRRAAGSVVRYGAREFEIDSPVAAVPFVEGGAIRVVSRYPIRFRCAGAGVRSIALAPKCLVGEVPASEFPALRGDLRFCIGESALAADERIYRRCAADDVVDVSEERFRTCAFVWREEGRRSRSREIRVRVGVEQTVSEVVGVLQGIASQLTLFVERPEEALVGERRFMECVERGQVVNVKRGVVEGGGEEEGEEREHVGRMEQQLKDLQGVVAGLVQRIQELERRAK